MHSLEDFEVQEQTLCREIAEIDELLAGSIREASSRNTPSEFEPADENKAHFESHHDETRVTDAAPVTGDSFLDIQEDEPASITPCETPMPEMEIFEKPRPTRETSGEIHSVFEYFDAIREKLYASF